MSHALLIDVRRGALVESRHWGSIAVTGPGGDVAFSLGDIDAPIYPRSAVKPLQATAMVQAGCPVRGRGLALAAASHSGEPVHVELARQVLADSGLTTAALANEPDLPLGDSARADYLRAGGRPDAVHQNCSGKHAAMLATCVANGWPTSGYLGPEHPLQRAIRAGLDRLSGQPTTDATTDGCGAPLFAMSLRGLAAGFAGLATAADGTPGRLVADAMRAHPELVGGTGRDVTELMQAVPGSVAKDGAEGVYAVGLPDGSAVVLKIADGSARGRLPALLAGLARLGVHAQVAVPPVLGGGHPVGTVEATF